MLIEEMAKTHFTFTTGKAWGEASDDERRYQIKAMMKAMFVAETAGDDSIISDSREAESLTEDITRAKCAWTFRRICGLLRKEAAVSLATTGNSSGRWSLPGQG